MTPLQSDLPPNELLDLVRKWKKEEIAGGQATGPTSEGTGGATLAGYGPIPALPTLSLDFSAVQETKEMLSSFQNTIQDTYQSIRWATGSADTSIKLVEVEKVRQMMTPDGVSRDTPIRPVIRTFYDHIQPINDLDFHPQSAVLISGAKDRTIKFFDFAKSAARRAFRVIQDTHNVRSVAFHPCGDYLLAGTDHPIAHLYDVNTLQCYLSSQLHDSHIGGAINQVSPYGDWTVYEGVVDTAGILFLERWRDMNSM
ncbi:hypothetical protein R1sor_015991 [Riccia sorocarpa]|uniref:Cleavage stimulation factor 50 kDa subunit n=1 Tax=Riccia sorocarpa TaxID=122646 RepID=A0ABD3HGX0_9MARC